MKQVSGIYGAPAGHWVGNGFPVRSLFTYDSHGQHLSPFLMLDRAGPVRFEPTGLRRGVGEHPHRGFETVTIVYSGEIAHRDSMGNGGLIGPGDVQWMTAGSGVLHEEFHSPAFAEHGGTLDMVQLWVNLPAAAKFTQPRYQTLRAAAIPVIDLGQGVGRLRVIAGEYAGRQGPARTFSPLDVWDLRLSGNGGARLSFQGNRTVALAILTGSIRVNGDSHARDAQLVVLDRDAGDVLIEADDESAVLVLSGEPLNEPIVGYGPFVMNTRAQVLEALDDYRNGRFGRIEVPEVQARA